MTQEFNSEDDPDTFEGWMRCQAVDIETLTPSDKEMWYGYYIESKERSLASRKVGLMNLEPKPCEYQYAVAVREGINLWLILWIRTSQKGEIFILIPQSYLIPQGNRKWDPHTSYHSDGTLHWKSFGKARRSRKCQPLTAAFQGTEELLRIGGFEPKEVGAICKPTDFTRVVEVPPGVLGLRDGTVVVDLVEPNNEPSPFSSTPLVRQEVFKETIPWIMVRVFA
jgi:hypothetical protein